MATPIEVAAASVRIEPDMSRFGPDLSRGVESATRRNIAAATQLGSTLTRSVTLPAAAAAAGSVRAFATFDDAVTQSLAIVTDFGSTTREDFEKTARDISKSTTFSAAQAAEGFFFLASAGLDAEQQIAALPAVARFAQAGMFDLATATDLATDAQSALGLTVRDDATKNLENLTRVTDVLAKGNILANASIEQFARSLTNRAGAALRLVGKDVEEGVAVLAAFADQGVKGEEAGTRLDIVLRDLQTQAIENRQEFDALGISVFDSSGEMRNIADIIEDLEGALLGASDEQKRMTLLQLGFQDRSVASLLTLVGLSDQIRIYEQGLREAAGTTGEIADRQLESFNSQMTLAKNRIVTASIALGSQLAPSLVTIAGFAADVVEAFTGLPEPIRDATLLVVGLAAAAGPLLLLGGKVAQTILSLRALAAQQAITAGSARTLAAAQSGAAAAIGLTGTAAAGAAGRVGTARTIQGIGGAASTLTVGGAAAAGAARGGIFGRLFGRGGGAAGAASLGSRFARGLGISFAGELAAGFVHAIPTEEDTIGNSVKTTASAALRGAGIGATVGSIIPGIGTGIGAAAGAVIGGAVGFFRNRGGDEAIADEVEKSVAAAAKVPPEVAQLQGQALAQTIDEIVQAGLADGLDIEAAGERAAAVRESIEESLADGMSFEEAKRAAYSESGLVGLEVAAGLADGTRDAVGAIEFGSIFGTAFSNVGTASARAIEKDLIEQERQYEAYNEHVADLVAAGLVAVVAEIETKGPEAAAEARALAHDLETAMRIEGRLRGVAQENLAEWVEALKSGDVITQARLAGEELPAEVVEAIRAETKAYRDVGEEQTEAYVFGIRDGFISAIPTAEAEAENALDTILRSAADILDDASGLAIGSNWAGAVGDGIARIAPGWADIARSHAAATAVAVKDQWLISSPSRVGMDLGAAFAEGISLGIERTRLATPDTPSLGRAGTFDGSGTGSTVNNYSTEIVVNNPREAESIVRGTEKALAYARLAAG